MVGISLFIPVGHGLMMASMVVVVSVHVRMRVRVPWVVHIMKMIHVPVSCTVDMAHIAMVND